MGGGGGSRATCSLCQVHASKLLAHFLKENVPPCHFSSEILHKRHCLCLPFPSRLPILHGLAEAASPCQYRHKHEPCHPCEKCQPETTIYHPKANEKTLIDPQHSPDQEFKCVCVFLLGVRTFTCLYSLQIRHFSKSCKWCFLTLYTSTSIIKPQAFIRHCFRNAKLITEDAEKRAVTIRRALWFPGMPSLTTS